MNFVTCLKSMLVLSEGVNASFSVCVTISDVCFTKATQPFTNPDACFTIPDACFTKATQHFTNPDACFTIPDACFTIPNACFSKATQPQALVQLQQNSASL